MSENTKTYLVSFCDAKGTHELNITGDFGVYKDNCFLVYKSSETSNWANELVGVISLQNVIAVKLYGQ